VAHAILRAASPLVATLGSAKPSQVPVAEPVICLIPECVRGLRITIWDVLNWLARACRNSKSSMNTELELDDFRAVYELPPGRVGAWRRKLVVRLSDHIAVVGLIERRIVRYAEFARAGNFVIRTRHITRAASQGRVAPALDASYKGRGARIAARGHPHYGVRSRSRTRGPGSRPRLALLAPTGTR
jgi:hypothetical protein